MHKEARGYENKSGAKEQVMKGMLSGKEMLKKNQVKLKSKKISLLKVVMLPGKRKKDLTERHL